VRSIDIKMFSFKSKMGCRSYFYVTLIGVAALLVVQSVAQLRQADSVRMVQAGGEVVRTANEDKGQLTSCLGIANDTFLLEWKPRVFKTNEIVVFTIHLKMIADFLHGNVCLTIKLDGIPDPIYLDCRDQRCDEYVKFAKPYLPDLTCPIAKGYELKRAYPFEIKPTYPLPAGKYNIRAEVWNEASVRVLCFEGDFEIDDE